MEAARYSIMGSDHIGVFATCSEEHLFVGAGVTKNGKDMISQVLKVKCVDVTVSGSDLVGIFSRANSNGIVLSNLVLKEEVERLKALDLDLNIEVLESDLNAIGSNILANDRIAIINPDYGDHDMRKIGDALGVEVMKGHMDGFKTVGANNILTNSGLVINNRGTAQEQKDWDTFSGFGSVRTTANSGALGIGLSVIANSNGIVAGSTTTGFELNRIIQAMER